MIKKLAAVLAFAMALQGVAFAADGAIPVSITFKKSANVAVDYVASTAPAQDYALGTKHSSGNRIFAGSNKTSNIYYKELDTWKGVTTVTGCTGYTSPTAGESTFTGWTAQ
ncbi:hypothetical protein ANAEL_05350 [Anaerolineales bacterium]|nr:hypothetical protein ANAEL_05350 [Anaerolineales bacterium]